MILMILRRLSFWGDAAVFLWAAHGLVEIKIMPEFFETLMGRKFFEGTFPRIATALERIAKQLEETAKAKKAAEPLQVSDRSGRIIVLGSKGETGTWSSDAEIWVLHEGVDLDVDNLNRGTMAKQTVSLDDLIAAYEILYGRKV